MFCALLLLLFASLCLGEDGQAILSAPVKLKWPSKYSIRGRIVVPYSEFEEAFEAWYDGDNNRSRIDYYGGVTKTLQRGDVGQYGQWYGIIPMTTETFRNKPTCFIIPGTKLRHLKAQSMLPDITKFKHIGDKPHQGAHVHVYELKVKIRTTLYTHTLYVDRVHQSPVYYRSRRHDVNIQTHYDDHYIEFHDFRKVIEHPTEVFEKPTKGLLCHPFPEDESEARILANPMQEYIHPINASHVPIMHKAFVKKHGKKVGPDHEQRMNNFKHNLRYIQSMNRRNLTYKLKVNHFADQTAEELTHLTGLRVTPREERGEVVEEYVPNVADRQVPESRNWRLYGAVTQVKSQYTCGSCWSFGTSGAVEGAYFLKTGKLLRLSQQQQVDCAWGFGCQGCNGGEAWRAYKYIMKHGGLATEEDYGHYLAVDGYCHDDKVAKHVNISGYVNIPVGDTNALKVALYRHGPVAVAIDASPKEFRFYAHGVFYSKKCKKGVDDLNHLVLAVGYGTHQGHPYWLIKNSWSDRWGNDGYYLMSRKDNNCGVATDANFPVA